MEALESKLNQPLECLGAHLHEAFRFLDGFDHDPVPELYPPKIRDWAIYWSGLALGPSHPVKQLS